MANLGGYLVNQELDELREVGVNRKTKKIHLNTFILFSKFSFLCDNLNVVFGQFFSLKFCYIAKLLTVMRMQPSSSVKK